MTLSNDTEETSCACHTIISIIRMMILILLLLQPSTASISLYLYISASRALEISLDFVSRMQSRTRKDTPSFSFLSLSTLCVEAMT